MADTHYLPRAYSRSFGRGAYTSDVLRNLSLLYERLAQAIAYARRHGGLVAVAFIDLDHF